jgi:PAS domain S-box-containing protein
MGEGMGVAPAGLESLAVPESTTSGIFVVGRDRRILVFNEACERLTGCARSKALDERLRCGDLLDCGLAHKDRCPLDQIFAEGPGVRRRHVRLDWSERVRRWLEVTYTPLTDERGAAQYVVGVVRDVTDEVREERRLLEHGRRLGEELRVRRRELETKFGWGNILARSPLMERVFEQIRAACSNDNTVLICGESGTGKELVAKAIHDHGPRRSDRFVPVNCAALPGPLIESELFGHVKGSFTDASRDSLGLFRAATGGTLFLDEIAEMPVGTQAKLLRVLEEGVVRPVGGLEPVRVSVRVVAATNRDPDRAIREQMLRPDLYYRLSVITITLPPLRRRKEDIPLLAQHFIESRARDAGRPPPDLSEDALEALQDYSWPGNVRQLENAIARACALGRGDVIRVDDLPARITSAGRDDEIVIPLEQGSVSPLRATLREVEKDLILRALDLTRGNKSRAAEMLGVQRKHLYRKIAEYGIPAVRTPS